MELLENEVELVTELCERLKREKEKTTPDTTIRILDIGCGTGKLALYLEEEIGCEVTGIDPVQSNVEKARMKTSSVTFLVQSAEEMPFASDAFDFVVSLKSLHEIPRPGAALEESNRVLKSGGKIFIIDWIGGVAVTSSHGHARKYFSPERLKKSLSEAGFANISITPNKRMELMLSEGKKMVVR